MRVQLLHLACAGLLLLLLPHVNADCAAGVANCTTEVNTTVPSPQTNDDKCRFLALYKLCLERDATCSDATTETTAKKTDLGNPVCVDGACTSSGNECVGAHQECKTDKCACMAAYKISEGICVAKMVDDKCTEGDNTSCPALMTCTGTGTNAKCACMLGYKASNGMCQPKVIDDPCDAATKGDCGVNMVCTNSKCACNETLGNNGKGVCGSMCAPEYKGTVNSCTLKRPGDNCTTGQNDTCPSPMSCSAGICACPSPQKDNGMGVCAVNCTTGHGDNGRGQCASACANGFKGDVGSCTEKQVNDNCTANDNSTCGSNQWCRGTTGNATCVCVPSHISGTNRLCAVKKPGDMCTAGDDTTCGPNQKCKTDSKCGCQDEYQESADKSQCVTAGAAGLLLSLGLHFLPLAAVLAITRWF